MNPLFAVALLFRDQGAGRPGAFLGTCFSFRHDTHFLTAAHCVRDLDGRSLWIVSYRDWEVREIEEVHTHPNADIALLIAEQVKESGIEPFWDCVGNFMLGEDFMAFGFPEDSVGPSQGLPVPRMFKGYYQRFMPYQSHMGYHYVAGEISIPCPGGLSGGPVFRQGAPQMLTGVVTENIETTTLLHEQERVLGTGNVINEQYRRIVNYGIVIMLAPIKDWLDVNIPPRVHT